MVESTHLIGLVILFVLVRYQHQLLLEEDLLLCSTDERNWGEMYIINNIINEIPWYKCINIYTNGVKAMVGKIQGIYTNQNGCTQKMH